MKASPYYCPSLRVPRTGIFAVFAAACAMLPVAWLYAWATIETTPALNPLCTIGMACCLALYARWSAAWGKVRHPQWMGRAGAVIGIFAWYVQWAAWIAMNEHLVPASAAGATAIETALHLFVRPDLMTGVAAAMVTGSTSNITASFFILFWFVELIAHVLPPKNAGAGRAVVPFCEESKRWAKEVSVPVTFAFIDEPDLVKRRMENNPHDFLSILGPPIDDAAPRYAHLSFYRCDGKHSFITIINLVAMAPEENPIPELRTLSETVPDKIECFAQVDDPVVELLRVPVADPDLLLSQWTNASFDPSESPLPG